ncbi:MAG: acyl-CoA thioesterase [Pikeienuella sp.]
MKPQPPRRAAFALFRPIATRWQDNDVYGHVNNVVYYSFFDTLVNGWLIERGLLEVQRSEVIGLVVSSGCDYFAPAAYPDRLEGGLRVDRIGGSSVTYGLGIFQAGADSAAAAGRFTHVYVGMESRRPVPLSDAMRTALGELLL